MSFTADPEGTQKSFVTTPVQAVPTPHDLLEIELGPERTLAFILFITAHTQPTPGNLESYQNGTLLGGFFFVASRIGANALIDGAPANKAISMTPGAAALVEIVPTATGFKVQGTPGVNTEVEWRTAVVTAMTISAPISG